MTALFWLQLNNPEERLGSMNPPIVQYLEVLLFLGGVLLLAYVSLRFVLPRWFGMQRPEGGPIQVVSRYCLEPKRTLYLVKTGSEMFLIGTSETQVEYLTNIAPENAAEILDASRKEKLSPKSFPSLLRPQRSREG